MASSGQPLATNRSAKPSPGSWVRTPSATAAVNSVSTRSRMATMGLLAKNGKFIELGLQKFLDHPFVRAGGCGMDRVGDDGHLALDQDVDGAGTSRRLDAEASQVRLGKREEADSARASFAAH